MPTNHEIEEQEFGQGPRLWDADPDVCCAAFQLGACAHTEAFDEHETRNFRDEDIPDAVAEVACWFDEEPF